MENADNQNASEEKKQDGKPAEKKSWLKQIVDALESETATKQAESHKPELQSQNQKPEAEQDIKLPVDLDKFKDTFNFLKPSDISWKDRIMNKLKEYKRVLLITKKPDEKEFKAIVKASGIGIIIIGLIGFIIHIIAQLLTS